MSRFRRIRNELIRDWPEEYQSHSSTFHLDTQNNKVEFLMFFSICVNPILITLDFTTDCYPFRAPNVYIGNNHINYKRLLHSTWSFAQKLSGVECMCCSTILCHWHPQLTMKHITEEIKQNFNLKIRMMEIAHCKKIVDKYFGHYIPIEEFL
tara:strand:- start:31 stop:486 length:456 start_codon:yes stop_codon:yes gene_type:complete